MKLLLLTLLLLLSGFQTLPVNQLERKQDTLIAFPLSKSTIVAVQILEKGSS
jgi:hypothetical protein